MSAVLAFPHAADDSSLWLTKEEIAAAVGIHPRSINRYAAAGVIVPRLLPARKRNGKPIRQFMVSSLPAELRVKLAPEPAPQPAPAPSPLAIAPLFAGIPDAPPARALVPAKHRAEVARCFALIEPLIEWANRRQQYAGLRLADGTPVTTQDRMADYIAETESAAGRPISRATLMRWKRAWLEEGDAGLAPKVRVDKGKSRWAAENRVMADLAAWICMGDAQQPGQSVMVAWEQVCAYAEENGVEQPSYETVRSFLANPNEVSRSMKSLQARGKKGYEKVFANYLQRAYTEPSNLIWVSDHMISDVLVQDDVFEKDLKLCRVQMTTIIDYRARKVVGVSWCRNGSSHSIKRALLPAILEYGPPETWYADNSKDYRKVGKGASRDELAAARELSAEEARVLRGGVLNRLGIEVVSCKPFHPQSKHIEKYHRFFHERFDQAFHSYTSGATHLRRDETSLQLVRHKKLLAAGDTSDSKLPLASEYIAMAEAWIFDWYNTQHYHDGEGMNGRTPAECFKQELNPNQKPAPPFEMLAALMAETTRRKVQRCAVEINGVRFIASHTDMQAIAIMHELSGQDGKVDVAYDPLDMTRAAVLDLEGRPLCSLVAQEKTRFSHDDETGEAIRAMEQTRGMMAKATKTSVAELGQRVREAGHKTLAEQHRERAGLPAISSIVQKPRKTASGETAVAPMYHAEAVEAFFGASK